MPVVATVITMSLGIGIGVNAAIFSWIQAFVFHPIPGVTNGSSFYLVEPRADTGSYPGASWLEYCDLRERVNSLPELFAFRMASLTVGESGHAERAYGLLVSGNYFSALGLHPALGRFVRPDEVAPGTSVPIVVISHAFWQTHFGGTSTVLGRTVLVNGRALTVVGITPPQFQGTIIGLDFDLWVPATLAPALFAGSEELEDRSQRGYTMAGLLGAGRTIPAAQLELQDAMRQLAHDYPGTNAGVSGELLPFWQTPRGPQRLFVRALTMLQSVLILLLLAVCGNTANLLLARASTREREVGVRMALGAGRWRVASLLLTENLVLAILGAGIGVLVALWGSQALRAIPIYTGLPVRLQTGVDLAGLSFALGLGILCGLMFGVAPAIKLARLDSLRALRPGSIAGGRSRLRNALMGTEVGLALVVLIVAALFFRSFRETREVDPGFRRDGVLLAAYDLTGRNLGDRATREFIARLLQAIRAMPAVDAASIAVSVPLDIHGMPLRPFTLEGRAATNSVPDRALSNTVTADYFKTMGIPLTRGADFTALNDEVTPPQAIVNEEFVRRYLEGGEALGRRITVRGRSYVIVGVARTSLYDSFGEPPMPMIYFSYRDRLPPLGELHVRTRPGAELLLGPGVRRVVTALDPTLPVYNVRTLSDHVETNLFLRRIPVRLFTVLGPLLLALATIGIYAVVAYSVSRRTMEIGLRLALGARPNRVVVQIIRESLVAIIIGGVVGWLVAFVVAIHAIPGGAIDPFIFAGVPAILLLVAMTACWFPARRATRIDPVAALRQD